MSQVWERQISGSAAMVLLVLADFARDDGSKVFPSIETIAFKVGLHRRQTRYILQKLRNRGVLLVTREGRGRGRTTHYKIDIEALKAKEAPPPFDD